MFNDRREAGRQLVRRLVPYAAQEPVVVGLPRGGVPVAAEVVSLLERAAARSERIAAVLGRG